MQGVNSQVPSKEICDVLEAKAIVLGINGKGLVAGGAAGVTSVGGARGLPCASHSCFKYLNLYICVYIYKHTHIHIIKMHLSKILGEK